MTKSKLVPIKAIMLLIVFLLNTVTGFACAIGIDMGFNASQQTPEIQANHNGTLTNHGHEHGAGIQHQHVDLGSHQDKDHHQEQDGKKENCCKDAVAKLTASSKLTQRTDNLSQLSALFILLPSIIHRQFLSVRLPSNVPNAYFTQHCRSPISDVRIAIQSFQI